MALLEMIIETYQLSLLGAGMEQIRHYLERTYQSILHHVNDQLSFSSVQSNLMTYS